MHAVGFLTSDPFKAVGAGVGAAAVAGVVISATFYGSVSAVVQAPFKTLSPETSLLQFEM
jgi:hypothetical protein